MHPENKLLEELNRTIQYAKQKIATTLVNEHKNKNLDISKNDLMNISRVLEFEMEKVYKDMAPTFASIKEQIIHDRKKLLSK